MKRHAIVGLACALSILLGISLAQDIAAAEPKVELSGLDAISYSSPVLRDQPEITSLESVRSLAGSPSFAAGPALLGSWDTFLSKNGFAWEFMLDKRTGLPNLIQGSGIPWVPGAGNGLSLQDIHDWLDGSPNVDLPALERRARDLLAAYPGLFPVSQEDLVLVPEGSGERSGYLWVVEFQQQYYGIPVERSSVFFNVNNGNLVQFGAVNIAPVTVSPNPTVTREMAESILGGYIGGYTPMDQWSDPGHVSILPVGTTASLGAYDGPIGSGVSHRLVWTLAFVRAGVMGTWLAKIDAHTGEVLLFRDSNLYGTVTGGVYPVSNPEKGTIIPLPYVTVTNSGTKTADRGGNYAYSGGTSSVGIEGPYLKAKDYCADPPGTTALYTTAYPGDLAFSQSSGEDCVTPGIGGAANTHASRNAYYHISIGKQKARGWLPGNSWLTEYIEVEINNPGVPLPNGWTNGFFFGISSPTYRNPADVAGALLHEFGHGLDGSQEAHSADSGTAEAYADINSFFNTHDSCIAYSSSRYALASYGSDLFRYCDGWREDDYVRHTLNIPHTASNFTNIYCGLSLVGGGPCLREGHCEAQVISEAVWDLATRELPKSVPDQNTAWNIAERLFYLSANSAYSAFSCTVDASPPYAVLSSNGCGANSWFNKFLATDDDDGNLSNGTPHGGAIYTAFSAHGIACGNGIPTYANCPSLAAPSLTSTVSPGQVALSWNAMPNASKYYVLRNETGPNASYIIIAGSDPNSPPVTGTTFPDIEVANGVAYYYSVQAVKSIIVQGRLQDICFGSLASPVTATPGGLYTISGRITSGGSGLADVTITAQRLSAPSELTPSAVTDSNGNFYLQVIGDGQYDLVPYKKYWRFTQDHLQVTVNGSSVQGKDFQATQAWPIYGHVTTANNHAGLDGVAVVASPSSGSTFQSFTESGGHLKIPLVTDGSYMVSPSKAGYSFSPASTPATMNSAPVTGMEFEGVGAYTLSGNVDCNGQAANNVLIRVTGEGSATTAGGAYTLHLPGGSFTLTPSKDDCGFSPSSWTGTVSANMDPVNFTTSSPRFFIYGFVKSSDGAAVKDVTVSTNTGVSATTSNIGLYVLPSIPNGSYTLTASKAGYNFCPAPLQVTVSCDSVSGANFHVVGPLPGDCDGSGVVSIGEVQKAINMFLGLQALGCGVDGNGDGTVSIGEVQKVINSFLGLCSRTSSGQVTTHVPELAIGSLSAVQGNTITIPIHLYTNGAAVSAASFRISYDPVMLSLVSAAGAQGASKPLVFNVNGTTHVITLAEVDYTQNTVSDGDIANLTFLVTGATGTAVLSGSCGTSDPDGNDLPTTCTSGTITLPPTCSITCSASATPSSGTAPLTVSFSATATPTNCSGSVVYAWDYGDGATSSSQNCTHTYTAYGTYPWNLSTTIGAVPCSQTGTVTVTYPPGNYSISGKVTQDGLALAGVTVRLDGTTTTTTTNALGQYSFQGLGAGTYTIVPRMLCKRFTPQYLTVYNLSSSVINQNFAAGTVAFCNPCFTRRDDQLARCPISADPAQCFEQTRSTFVACLNMASHDANSPFYNATLLAISLTRADGQPTPETVPFAVQSEGDYVFNVTNGDQVNKDTMVSSATVDFAPGDRVFGPNDFNKNVALLTKTVHLLPGNYSLTTELRSEPGAYLTIVISNLDFGGLPK